MTTTALNNQSLLDIAIQATGKAENLLKIAMDNSLVPSEPLIPGQTILVSDTLNVNQDVLRYYTAHNIMPATAPTQDLQQVELTCEQKLYECFKD